MATTGMCERVRACLTTCGLQWPPKVRLYESVRVESRTRMPESSSLYWLGGMPHMPNSAASVSPQRADA
jgi:hypothetical protein